MILPNRQFATLAVLVTLSACVGWMPRRGSGPVIGGSPGGDGSLPGSTGGPAQVSGLSKKAVFGKREPVTLIAKDKTECTVTESRFKEAAVGEKVTCEWRSP